MAKTSQRKEIFVYAHCSGLSESMLMGTLYVEVTRVKEIFSFEYTREWLSSKYAQVIDPDLQLFSGSQYKNFIGIRLPPGSV